MFRIRRLTGVCLIVIFAMTMLPAVAAHHSADSSSDFVISLQELLRVIQFYNSGGLHCLEGTEDGYAPGPGDSTCTAHDSDYDPGGPDWTINLTELLRLIQFFNSGGYHTAAGTEDEFGPSPVTPEGDAERIGAGFSVIDGLLSVPAPAVLGEREAQALADKLAAARQAYENGDPCDAADLLGEFENMTQALRAGIATEMTEALYALGRMTRYAMLAPRYPGAACPGFERVGMPADAVLDEASSDNEQTLATARFGEPRFTVAEAASQVFTEIFVPDATGQMPEGKPAVPFTRRFIAAPRGAEPSLSYELTLGETIHVNLFPAQNPRVEPIDRVAPALRAANVAPPFAMNTEVYQTDAWYPPAPVTITSLGQFRDLRVFAVDVAAGQYNPVTDEFQLFASVDFEVQFNAGPGAAFVTEASKSPFEPESEFLAGMMLNGNLIFEYVEPVITMPLEISEEFMILTHPNFRAAANALAAWKVQKGIITRIYEVGTGTAYETAEEIEALIDDRFNNGKIRPSYVLLLGDAEFVPTFYVPYNFDDIDEEIATDWPYGNVAAGFFDVLTDLGVGRIPVDTLAEANVVVNKILDYEQTPPTNSAFYQHATVAGQFQCCRKDVSQKGANQMRFTEPSEFAVDVMARHGYDVERIYKMTVDNGCALPDCDPAIPAYTGDTTPRYHYDMIPMPAAIGPGSNFGWNGSGADVVDAINEGRFLIIHNDHGYVGGWGEPNFDYTLIPNLTNGELLPVIFSINCSSGFFDNETVDPTDDDTVWYFVDRMLRFNGLGAVGMIAATRMSWTYSNATFSNGLVDAIWPDAIPSYGSNTSRTRLGDILIHGQLYLLSQLYTHDWLGPRDIGDEIHLFHVFGDPTLSMWTQQPLLTQFTAPPAATVDGDYLEINVDADGRIVTATKYSPDAGLVPIGRGKVENGKASLKLFEPANPGDMITLSVGGRGYVSTSTLVTVASADTTAPADVTGFLAAPGNARADLTWANPTDADFAGVRIQRKINEAPAGPEDGDTVYEGLDESYQDTGLTGGVSYCYAIYTVDSVPNYSAGKQACVLPYVAR